MAKEILAFHLDNARAEAALVLFRASGNVEEFPARPTDELIEVTRESAVRHIAQVTAAIDDLDRITKMLNAEREHLELSQLDAPI